MTATAMAIPTPSSTISSSSMLTRSPSCFEPQELGHDNAQHIPTPGGDPADDDDLQDAAHEIDAGQFAFDKTHNHECDDRQQDRDWQGGADRQEEVRRQRKDGANNVGKAHR